MTGTKATTEPHLDAHFPRAAKYQADPEHPNGGRGDIAVTTSKNGAATTTILDVTVVAPDHHYPRAFKKVAATAERASRKKDIKYNSNYVIPSGQFVAIALESTGAMTPKAATWFKHMARNGRSSTTQALYATNINYLMQRVSAALQKGDARMIRHWQAAIFVAAAAQAEPPAVVAGPAAAVGAGAL